MTQGQLLSRVQLVWSQFSIFQTGYLSWVKESSLFYYLNLAVGIQTFPNATWVKFSNESLKKAQVRDKRYKWYPHSFISPRSVAIFRYRQKSTKQFSPYLIDWVISSSSSSCCTASTDIPDPLSPLLPIVHRFWQVFRATSRILNEQLYVCSRWSSCFSSAICWGP